MSGTVKVELNSSEDETLSVPVVVSVLDEDLETVAGPTSFFISEDPSFPVDPGAYVVHVDPPSGQRLKRTVRVAQGKQTTAEFWLHQLGGHETLEKTALLRGVDRRPESSGLDGDAYASSWAKLWRRELPSGEWRLAPFAPESAWNESDGVRYKFGWLPRTQHLVQIGGPGLAWRHVAVPAHEQITVTVLPDPDLDGEVQVSAVTGNDVAESLLGYLQSGYIQHADALLARAEDLLFGKLEDPIAAAIGGYFLLRVRRFERLRSWAPNLARFEWLPDGAVIDGWQHLHAGKDSGDDAEFGRARQQLLLAASRGVPVYTEGLRLLIDGLNVIATPEDRQVQKALTRLRRYGDAVDWAAVTVSFTGVDPTRPDSAPRYGAPTSTAGMVFLHHVELSDLVRSGFLAPDTNVRLEHSPKVTGTVTGRGQLRLSTGAVFDDPVEAARSIPWREPWADLWVLQSRSRRRRWLSEIYDQARSQSVRAALSDPADRLGLSTRTARALRNAGLTSVGDVVEHYDTLADISGIGKRSMFEIANSLTASELHPVTLAAHH